jgi:hypothetical protein
MTIKDIVEKYLKENNCDGLFNDDAECGCDIDDLSPCTQCDLECKAGFKTPCPGPDKCDTAAEFNGECAGHWSESKC